MLRANIRDRHASLVLGLPVLDQCAPDDARCTTRPKPIQVLSLNDKLPLPLFDGAGPSQLTAKPGFA